MSGIQVSTLNGTKVYNLTTGKQASEFLSDFKRRELSKNDENYRHRVQLLQDFEFPSACQRISVSRNGRHFITSGTYPPSLKIYDLDEMSLKCMRGLDEVVVDQLLLSDDFGKIVLLQSNRTVSFHAPYGYHYSTRIPTYGRALAYRSSSCDVFIASAQNKVYNLNLEDGRFLESLSGERVQTGFSCIDVNPVHGLVLAGSDDGLVCAWDPRQKKELSTLEIGSGVTAIQQHQNGLNFMVGSEDSQVRLFDLRASAPIASKAHVNGTPIRKVLYAGESHIVSADNQLIKIWNSETLEVMTNIETPCPLNDFDVQEGLIVVGGEQSINSVYYVPSLGPAPRWCAFMDHITEELEEETSKPFQDHQFVTPKELEALGLSHLIGSNFVSAYMHGYFMDASLYHRAKDLADDFSYEDWQKKKLEDKRKARLQERIEVKAPANQSSNRTHTSEGKRITINKELAKTEKFKAVVQDDRFSKMFHESGFERDDETLARKTWAESEDEEEQDDRPLGERATEVHG